MQGWKLFKHAFGMVTRNWREALRIFLVPAILGIAFLALMIGAIASSTSPQNDPSAFSLFWVLMVFLFSAGLATWCIVAWHRFVILEELPQGWIPPVQWQSIGSYWVQILKLTLIAIVVTIPAVFVIMVISRAGLFVLMLIVIPAYFLAIIAFVRLSIMLPAAAVGKPLSPGEAFAATKNQAGAILLLILIGACLQGLVQGVVTLFIDTLPLLGIAVSIGGTIFLSLLNISTLTTLYGHYVEGRPID